MNGACSAEIDQHWDQIGRNHIIWNVFGGSGSCKEGSINFTLADRERLVFFICICLFPEELEWICGNKQFKRVAGNISKIINYPQLLLILKTYYIHISNQKSNHSFLIF